MIDSEQLGSWGHCHVCNLIVAKDYNDHFLVFEFILLVSKVHFRKRNRFNWPFS